VSTHTAEAISALVAAVLVALAGRYLGLFLHWLEHRLTHQTIRPHVLMPEPPQPQTFVPTMPMSAASSVASLQQQALMRGLQTSAAHQQQLAARLGNVFYGRSGTALAETTEWFDSNAPQERP